MTERPARAARTVTRGAAVAAAVVVLVTAATAVLVALAAPGDSLRVTVRLLPLVLVVGALAVVAVLGTAVLRARTRRRSTQRLEHAREQARRFEQEARTRFLARLDHELKNPVTAIRAAVAGAGDDAGPEERARSLATLVSQSTRLSALVADLRKLAELGTQEIEDEDVDLAQVVRDAVEDVCAQADAAGAPRPAVDVALPTAPWPLPHVRGDVDLLYVAVYNLLANAVKFSPPGTRIEVRGTDDDGTVLVEVADAGPGIPQDEVGVVFDELARGRDARGLPGSGIGLALVRVVAQRHGGDVTLRSRVGQGTSVRLRVPTAGPSGGGPTVR
ncbi:sensor histidine kinase [Cellulomonas fimi]|uniref:sensor histidine kinase n=1 Tax=Cellulomonas fimi TaxID=1708 RepID=UPI00145F96DA|nr:HAMP domain-containing sensor histidine kinase [Cellulomonas fimi]